MTSRKEGWCYPENLSALLKGEPSGLFPCSDTKKPFDQHGTFQSWALSPGNCHVDTHPPTPLLGGLPSSPAPAHWWPHLVWPR